MNNKDSKFPGSGDDVANFSYLCEGDTDPHLNKQINTLIQSDDNFIVYLDNEYFVEWATTDSYEKFSPNFGKILNKVSLLETKSISLLSPKHIKPFRRLLGEAIARTLDMQDDKIAEKFLHEAENYLQLRSVERAKIWYLVTSTITCFMLLALTLTLWLNKNYVLTFLTENAFEIIIVSLTGSIGAFISVLYWIQNITMNAEAGPIIHCLESGIRIFTGVAGAFLAMLVIKANLILGITNTLTATIYPLVVIGMVAGASERFVPDLIEKFENTIGNGEVKKA